jgi:hypothetical protein
VVLPAGLGAMHRDSGIDVHGGAPCRSTIAESHQIRPLLPCDQNPECLVDNNGPVEQQSTQTGGIPEEENEYKMGNTKIEHTFLVF